MMGYAERKQYQLGMVVQLKKAHPCGSANWKITRTGIDFGLQCLGCGHRVMIPRRKFEKAVRSIVSDFPGNDVPSP